MNKIQSENHRTGIYEISKFLFSCFDNEIYILGNRIAVLAFGA